MLQCTLAPFIEISYNDDILFFNNLWDSGVSLVLRSGPATVRTGPEIPHFNSKAGEITLMISLKNLQGKQQNARTLILI